MAMPLRRWPIESPDDCQDLDSARASPPAFRQIRVLVADDQPVARAGLRQILDRHQGIAVLGEAATGTEVRRLVAQKPWDVVVLNVSMPDCRGLQLLKEIKCTRPKLPVLILSSYPEEKFAVRALRAGAAGYVTKKAAPEELVSAVWRLAQGLRYMTPTAAEELIQALKTQYTIVIVTHNMQQAGRVSDFTAFFYLGKLIEFGPTVKIFTNPGEKQTEDYITGRFG